MTQELVQNWFIKLQQQIAILIITFESQRKLSKKSPIIECQLMTQEISQSKASNESILTQTKRLNGKNQIIND